MVQNRAVGEAYSQPAEKEQITDKAGVTKISGNGDVAKFLEIARYGKVWELDPCSPVR